MVGEVIRMDEIDPVLVVPADDPSLDPFSSAVDQILEGVAALIDPEDPDGPALGPTVILIDNSTVVPADVPADEELDVVQLPSEEEEEEVWVYDEEYGIQTYVMNPVSDSSGLKGVLIDIIGPYDSIITEYRYQNPSSTTYQYVRQIDKDYVWLGSLVVFLVLLFSVFRIGGHLLCKR